MASSDPIRLGLIFSRSGVTSHQELSQLQAALFAVDEINANGGIQGREIIPVHFDPKSETPLYRAGLEALIESDGINIALGGYTSSSRKAMLPVVEKYQKLLFYPQQYEGFEFSENIIYTGASPNQNIVQLASHMTSRFGARIYAIGSRYAYPYETNRTMQSLVSSTPGAEFIGERYVSMHANRSAVDEVFEDILRKRPDFIFCTLIGNAVPYLYQAFLRAGLDPNKMPIASLNTSEAEISMMGAAAAEGHLTSSPYFQSIDSAVNKRTLAKFLASRYGEHAIPNMNWEASYIAVHLFAKACRQCGSDDPKEVLEAVKGSEIDAPQGLIRIDSLNHHAALFPRIGRANAQGQFTIVEDSGQRLDPDPYMAQHNWASESVE